MNYPKSIPPIAGVDIKVVYKDKLKDDDGNDVYGMSDGGEHTIHICKTKNNTPQKLRSTLFHEACHMCLYITGNSQSLSTAKEESIVLAFEHVMLDWVDKLKLQ
ncbi:MAG: hypothetical protein ACOH5I_26490 [Oligoflexus sp.]